MEIKLTTSPGPSHMARLDANADLVGADRRFLVCHRSELVESGARILCDLPGLIDYIRR